MSLAPPAAAQSRVTTHGMGIALVLMVLFTFLPIGATVALLLAYEAISGVHVALFMPVVFLLVPATMKLLGRFNWWPSSLSRPRR